MTWKIKIESTEDIKKINDICCSFPFDISISNKMGIVDAKSLLGMFMLSSCPENFLVVEDDVNAKKLLKKMKDFLVDE